MNTHSFFFKISLALILAGLIPFYCSCGGSGSSTSVIGSGSSGGGSTGTTGGTGGGNTGGNNNITSPTNHSDWEYIGAKVDSGAQNTFPIPRLVLDRINKQVFVSVLNQNEIFVADSTTHRKKTTIPLPSPTGMDMSPDGSRLYVGSLTNFLYVIDPVSLQIRQIINTVQIGYGGFSVIAPVVLNDGRILMILGAGVDGSPQCVVWSPSDNSAQIYAASDDVHAWGGAIANASRSKAMISSTSGRSQLWDVASGQMIPLAPPNASIIERAAANPAKDQFALSDLGGTMSIFDSSGTILASLREAPAGQSGGSHLNGLVFSDDGSKLYVMVEDIIRVYETSSFQQLGAGMQPFTLGTFAEPLPFAADSAGIIYGVNEDGLAFIDASMIGHNGVTDLPLNTGIISSYLTANTGPLAGGTSTTARMSWGVDLPTPASLTPFVGARSASNVSWNTPQTAAAHLDFTVPPGLAAGPADVLIQLPDGTAQYNPLAFSYGPSVLALSTTASTPDGGGTGFLAGYGFGDTTAGVQLSLNGSAAIVTQVQTQPSGIDNPYPTPLRGLAYTIPPSTAGLADITVTTPSGAASLRQAFRYTDPGKLHSTTDSLQAGVYDASRHRIYFSAKDHIAVLSVPGGDWQPSISVPNAATARLVAASISPTGKMVAVADQGNRAIVVFNPDNPSQVQAFPVSDGGFGLQPAGLAVTDQGLVYFLLSYPWGQSGGRCQNDLFWQLDTATGLVEDLTPSNSWCSDSQNRVLLNSGGDRVYIDADGSLKVYFPSSGVVEFVELGSPTSDMTLAKDGTRLAQQSTVITEDGDVKGTPLETEVEGSDTFDPRYGQKLDRRGALLLQPWSTALDLDDLGQFRVRQRIALNVQVQNVFDSLVWDDDDNRAFLMVNGGVLELPIYLPLVLSSTSPDSLSPGGGTVQLVGTGFTTDTTATLDGRPVSVSFSDTNTLVLQAPAHAEGAVRIKLTRGDGQTTFLDLPLYGNGSNSSGSAEKQRRRAGLERLTNRSLDIRPLQQRPSHHR